MKKQSIKRTLVLNRKTVSNLDARDMEGLKGGDIYIPSYNYPTCVSKLAGCRTNENCSCVGTICA